MIKLNNKDIIDIHLGTRGIMSVYLGTKLVWNKQTKILSCFSNGYWIDEYPWVDTEIWMD